MQRMKDFLTYSHRELELSEVSSHTQAISHLGSLTPASLHTGIRVSDAFTRKHSFSTDFPMLMMESLSS